MTYIDRFQNAILALMTWTMALVTLIVTLDVIYSLARYLLLPPVSLQINELLNFFASILLVVIGVELLDTFRKIEHDKTVNVLTILLVTLISVARKVILMGLNDTPDYMGLIGLSVIIISLSLGYYLIKKSSQSS
jgi:uncharacterized membrane protein (DUF373 family)